MFMREFRVIDAASSVDQLRRRLKNEELEQYGEPFTPEFVYDVIRKLPRFASMRVSATALSESRRVWAYIVRFKKI
jgi:ubiquitin carboxyl-terminal hydrolase 10